MAPACVSIWTNCLQDLRRLPAVIDNPAEVFPAVSRIATKLDQWRGLPTLSASHWSQLVLEVKVPDVLIAVCCSTAQTNPTSAAACTAFTALEAFCGKATEQGGPCSPTPDSTRMGPSSSTSSRRVGSNRSSSSSRRNVQDLGSDLRSQVLQAKLMDAFAAAMSSAATTCLQAGAADDTLDRTMQDSPSSGQTAAFSASEVLSGMQDKQGHFIKPLGSYSLLRSWVNVSLLWPDGPERLSIAAIAAPAAMQLSAAIMQVVSRHLPAAVAAAAAGAAPQVQPNTVTASNFASKVLNEAVQAVLCSVSWLTLIITNNTAGQPSFMNLPELQPLLVMPEFTTALATMLVITAEALLAQQKLGPTAAAAKSTSSSTSASSSSSSSSPASASRVMSSSKMTRKLEAVLRNLPECTKALLETLGMDSRAMVWAAAAQRDVATTEGLSDIAVKLVSVLQLQLVAVTGVSGTQKHLWVVKLRKLLLQVPALLLHWAASSPVLTEKQLVQCATVGPYYSYDYIEAWLNTPFDRPAFIQGPGPSEPWLQPSLPAVWLEQVLPDIQKLLTVLLPRCWKPQQATGTASQSGGAPSLAAAGALQGHSDLLAILQGAPGRLVQLQCRILQSAEDDDSQGTQNGAPQCNMVDFDAADNTAPQPQSRSRRHQLTKPLAEFRSVTVQTLASLEGFIRASAQQLAAGSMPDPSLSVAISAINAALMTKGGQVPGVLLSLTVVAGPGSREQQQLYSLLSSLLKFSALGANSSDAALAGSLTRSCIILGNAAMELLDMVGYEECDSSSSRRTTTASNSTGPSTAVTLLPSLVLVGRCCLLWAQHLQQAVPQLLRVHAGMGTVPPQQALQHRSFTPSAGVVILLCFLITEQIRGCAVTTLMHFVGSLFNRLEAPAVAQQLAAAGHNTQHLPQTLQELVSAGRTAAEAWPSDNFTEATAMALVQQLQVTGRALAGLAVPTMCCNPICSNITGPSDLQLVSGRSCLCGGCMTARYCSRTCQKAAWKQHKSACSALAAAAPAATAAAPGATAEFQAEPQATI